MPFFFAAADDALVSVETVGLGGDGAVSFKVFGPDGTEVCDQFGCALTQTGVYTILVSNRFNDGTVPYSLALNCIVGICPPPPPPSAPSTCNGLPVTIQGTDSSDTLIGTSGNDVIDGQGGNDVLRGEGGNDVLCGGDGRDRLFGGPGRDRQFGGADRDQLFGDKGRDALNGGTGRDRCDGGPGTDTARSCDIRVRVP